VLFNPLNYPRRTEPFSFLFERWTTIFEENERIFKIIALNAWIFKILAYL